MITGFVWFNPKVFGNTWMSAAGVTPEMAKGSNMALIFGFTYFLGLMLTMALHPVVIHQMHIYSIFANTEGFGKEGSKIMDYIADFMAKNGQNFRTFKHGALHGTIAGIFLVMPCIATNALFERKGFKYIAINSGFWILNLMLMGGLVCQFG
jgi:hypothetical protein